MNDGKTPLHIAAYNGHLDVVKYIAGYLEDKNPVTNDGSTPLSLAEVAGHLEIFSYLKGNKKMKK